MSTLLILTFSTFEVGSILDFFHAGFFRYRILSVNGLNISMDPTVTVIAVFMV